MMETIDLPFFQVALPLMITILIAAFTAVWSSNKRIEEISRRLDDTNRRIESAGRRHQPTPRPIRSGNSRHPEDTGVDRSSPHRIG